MSAIEWTLTRAKCIPGRLRTAGQSGLATTAVVLKPWAIVAIAIGLAPAPAAATAFGVDAATAELLRIDTSTGAATAVGPLGVSSPLGLAFDNNGTLFGVAGGGSFTTINTNTGAASFVGTLGFDSVQDLTFDPLTNTLYGVDVDTDQLLTIDRITGTATAVGAVGALGFDIVFGIAFDPGTGTLFGADLDTDQLLTIDTTTGAASAVGSFGVSFVAGLGFDAESDVLYGTSADPFNPSPPLLTINTSTGAATSVGPLGFDRVSDIAFAPVPEPATLAMFGLGLAGLGFARRRKAG